MTMEWKEINEKAIELAYEVLKKLNKEHAEEFNPENHYGGIQKDSFRYTERIDESCDIPIVELSIIAAPKQTKKDVENMAHD